MDLLWVEAEKATSDPEIMAEQKRRMTTTAIPVMVPPLSGATTAILGFDYNGYGAGGLDIVAVEVSDNGGGSYTTLESFEVVGNVSGRKSYRLEDHISLNADVVVRFRDRRARVASLHSDRESPEIRTPAPVPVVTSMSSSNSARGWKEASRYRVTYMVGGSQPPATRWSTIEVTGVRYDAVDRTLYVDSRIGDFRSFLCTNTGYGTVELRGGQATLTVMSGTIPVESTVVAR